MIMWIVHFVINQLSINSLTKFKDFLNYWYSNLSVFIFRTTNEQKLTLWLNALYMILIWAILFLILTLLRTRNIYMICMQSLIIMESCKQDTTLVLWKMKSFKLGLIMTIQVSIQYLRQESLQNMLIFYFTSEKMYLN